MTAQTFPPQLTPAVPEEARLHAEDLGTFVAASPSSYHAAAEVARRAQAAGFTLLAEDAAWGVTQGGRYAVVRDGSVIVFTVPDAAGPTTRFTIVGAHTDTTGFKLKPKPTTHGAGGWWQAGVEVYGGPLLNSWLDRELELAGRIVTHDGTEHLVRTGPMLRIPQLAIHLDRGVNDKGLALDKQRHTQPVWGLGDAESADILAALAADAGVDPADDRRVRHRAGRHPACPRLRRRPGAVRVGAAGQPALHARGADGDPRPKRFRRELDERRDVRGLRPRGDRQRVPLGRGGAVPGGGAGPHLDRPGRHRGGAGARVRGVAARVVRRRARGAPELRRAARPGQPPVAGGGPILKINANQRYATDAHGAAAWTVACATAGVPTQEFVSNNVMPCGSTIGPISATRLGIRTVDVGVPILSMHSARELTAVVDPWYLSRAMEGRSRSLNSSNPPGTGWYRGSSERPALLHVFV